MFRPTAEGGPRLITLNIALNEIRTHARPPPWICRRGQNARVNGVWGAGGSTPAHPSFAVLLVAEHRRIQPRPPKPKPHRKRPVAKPGERRGWGAKDAFRANAGPRQETPKQRRRKPCGWGGGGYAPLPKQLTTHEANRV